MVTKTVPIIVALGIVFPGFLIFPAGIVAASKPINAKRHNAVHMVIALKEDTSLMFKGLKCANWMKNNPPIVTTTKGTILRMVVINCVLPPALTL